MSYGQLCPYLHAERLRLAQSRLAASHLHRRRLCDGDAWIRRDEWKPGDSGFGPGASSRPTGRSLTLSRAKDGDTFLGAVVNLGALGVVTKVTLDVQPSFMVRQYVYENLPLAQLTDHFEDIMSSGYSVSLFTDWQNKRINQVWVKRRVEKGDAVGDQARVPWRESRLQEPCTRSPNSRRRTARSRWECPGPGMSGCLISAWGSLPAVARSCSRSTSSRARTRSKPSWRSRDCVTE